jgi:endonuclease/exonuclease/phosphatase (EEP) superfamily protein YafD
MVDGRNLDTAEQRIDDWQSGIEQQAARARALAARLAEVTGSARSNDGLIEVIVDSSAA